MLFEWCCRHVYRPVRFVVFARDGNPPEWCAQCDTLHEGFLNDPRQCSFDYASLACPAGKSGEACLTPGELKTVTASYGSGQA